MTKSPARVFALALLLLTAGCGEGAPEPPHAPGLGPGRPAAETSEALRPGQSESPQPAQPRLGPYPRSQFYIERDRFLAADEPRMVPAGEAAFLRPADEVLGLIVGGVARAYAVTMLSYHHVVNDVIEGIPVAVTY